MMMMVTGCIKKPNPPFRPIRLWCRPCLTSRPARRRRPTKIEVVRCRSGLRIECAMRDVEVEWVVDKAEQRREKPRATPAPESGLLRTPSKPPAHPVEQIHFPVYTSEQPLRGAPLPFVLGLGYRFSFVNQQISECRSFSPLTS